MEPGLSQSSGNVTEAAVFIQEQVVRAGYTSLPAYVILYYDYLLTLGDEIRLFWPNKKLTTVTVVFYLNRYISLIGYVPLLFGRHVLSLSSDKTQACHNLLRYHQYLAGLIQIIAGIALALRTYALYGRRRRILYPLVILGFAVVGFGFWAVHDISMHPRELFNPTSCLLPISKQDANHYAGAWAGVVLFDTTIFIMTVHKSIGRWREESHQDTTLLHVFVRDGTVYFGVMVIITLSLIVSLYIFPDYDRAITTSLTNVLSSVMIFRFMLNLRDPIITSNAKFQPRTLTTLMNTSFSDDESECISNGEVILRQMGVTSSQVMLPGPKARIRTSTDASDVTIVPLLHVTDWNEGEGPARDVNKYQMKIQESF